MTDGALLQLISMIFVSSLAACMEANAPWKRPARNVLQRKKKSIQRGARTVFLNIASVGISTLSVAVWTFTVAAC